MTQPPEYPGSNDPNGNEPPSYPSSGSEPPSYQPPPPTHQAYGQQDYGQQYGQQYGQSGDNNPYGAWQGGNDAGQGTDGLSIAAFVFSLTCCLSFVGVILGFIGLGRTKNGQRKGRWAAVTAIIVGIILTLVTIAVGVGIWYVAKNRISPDNAEVGQCADVTKHEDDGEDSYSLSKKDCSEDHDAEVVVVAKYSDSDANPLEFCMSRLSDEHAAAVTAEGLEIKALTEDPPPDDGDNVLCYAEKADGTKLKGKIGG